MSRPKSSPFSRAAREDTRPGRSSGLEFEDRLPGSRRSEPQPRACTRFIIGRRAVGDIGPPPAPPARLFRRSPLLWLLVVPLLVVRLFLVGLLVLGPVLGAA